MKTTMKQLATATIIALFVLVIHVKAEGTEKIASKNENIETTLQLEKWMTDENVWKTNSGTVNRFSQEIEAGLEIESWMTNAVTWDFEAVIVQEAEPVLELEGWMTSEETWNKNDLNHEMALTVEGWMTDSNIWK